MTQPVFTAPCSPPRRRCPVAKRDIERALRKKGVVADGLSWDWQVTPGEMVPCWTLDLSDESAEKFGEDHTHFFDNTAEAIEWIEALQVTTSHPHTEYPADTCIAGNGELQS